MGWDKRRKAALMAVMLLVPAAARAGTLFDGGTMGPNGFAMFPFWQQVLADAPAADGMSASAKVSADHNESTVTIGAPAGCSEARHCAPPEWLSFLEGQRALDRRAQLDAVNRWANAKPYVEDWVNWHVADYWETPGEFIAKGGDCEDFAIAKYFSLVRLGFPAQDLRILVVSDTATHGFHAVLAARLDGMVWLLDNFTADVVPLESKPQYQPVYSLNAQGWWMHSTPSLQVAGLTITAAPLAAAQPVLLARN